jgi:hypothetical protein
LFTILVALLLGLVAWWALGILAEKRQLQALGYRGDGGVSGRAYVQRLARPGMSPSEAYRLLSSGAEVRYYREAVSGSDSVIVQWFDYSMLGAGPYVAVEC